MDPWSTSRWRGPTSERGELVLRRAYATTTRSDVLELRVNGVFVMDTARDHAPSARWPTPRSRWSTDPRGVLVGGLGLGFTLARGARRPRGSSRCVVVEIEAALVEWMRDGTIPHGPALLADARLHDRRRRHRDGGRGGRPRRRYDLVLLDVDNGPGYLVHDGNARALPADVPRPPCDARCAPGGVARRSGRPTSRRSSRDALRDGVRRRRRARPTTSTSRTATSTTGSTSRRDVARG